MLSYFSKLSCHTESNWLYQETEAISRFTDSNTRDSPIYTERDTEILSQNIWANKMLILFSSSTSIFSLTCSLSPGKPTRSVYDITEQVEFLGTEWKVALKCSNGNFLGRSRRKSKTRGKALLRVRNFCIQRRVVSVFNRNIRFVFLLSLFHIARWI